MKKHIGRTCLLFPGQGAQYPGMGRDLWETSDTVKELFALGSRAAGIDLEALLFEADEEELKRTENTQVAITAVNLAVLAVLDERGVAPSVVAGFSLGEFSALVAAGVLSPEQVFPLVKERGLIMADVAAKLYNEAGEGPGMAAVMGLSPETVESLCAESELELYAANFNSPDQTVVAGTKDALAKGKEFFSDRGAKRWIPLKVTGPFHTPLLAEAKEAFAEVVGRCDYREPKIVLLSNVTGGKVESAPKAKELSIEQVTSPVRWTDEEAAVVAAGAEVCIEAGPGKVLSGLWKKSGHSIPCFPAGTVESMASIFE